MGMVYRLVLSDDSGAPAQMDPSIAALVTFDGATGGKLVSGEYQALLIGTEIVPLPHPSESFTLKKHGETFVSASMKGRYLRVTQRVCMSCGTLVDTPQIGFGSPGCLPSLVASVVAGGYVWSGDRSNSIDVAMAAIGAMFGGLLVTWFLGFVYVKLRWRGRQKTIAKAACSACGGKILRSISSLAGQTVPLEGQTRTVSVSVAGRS